MKNVQSYSSHYQERYIFNLVQLQKIPNTIECSIYVIVNINLQPTKRFYLYCYNNNEVIVCLSFCLLNIK